MKPSKDMVYLVDQVSKKTRSAIAVVAVTGKTEEEVRQAIFELSQFWGAAFTPANARRVAGFEATPPKKPAAKKPAAQKPAATASKKKTTSRKKK